MAYSHTQKGKWHYLFYTLSISFVLLAWMLREEPAALFGLLLAAALMLIAALGFGYLTVRDEGLWLAIRYGPLPLFAKRIPYAAMKSVEPDRSSVIDGWGIHWIPGRGWVYNLWGFDCVKVSLSRRVIRIGTDDVKNLVAFLRTKVQEGP